MVGFRPDTIGEIKFHHAMWIHGAAGQLDWEPDLPDIGWEEVLNFGYWIAFQNGHKILDLIITSKEDTSVVELRLR